MKNDSSDELKEALTILNSDQGDRFVQDLEESVKEALIKTVGETQGSIESAVELDDKEKMRLEEMLGAMLKSEMEFTYTINPRLLGGFSVTVGDWKLDASIHKQLEQMKKELRGN